MFIFFDAPKNQLQKLNGESKTRIAWHISLITRIRNRMGKMAYVTGEFPVKIALGIPHNPVCPGTTANFD